MHSDEKLDEVPTLLKAARGGRKIVWDYAYEIYDKARRVTFPSMHNARRTSRQPWTRLVLFRIYISSLDHNVLFVASLRLPLPPSTSRSLSPSVALTIIASEWHCTSLYNLETLARDLYTTASWPIASCRSASRKSEWDISLRSFHHIAREII